MIAVSLSTAEAGVITVWSFENDSIAVNNSRTASAIGMTNTYNSTSSNTNSVVQGVSGDTGSNGVADLTQDWRVRGQSPGNGWSNQASIGTQGAARATVSRLPSIGMRLLKVKQICNWNTPRMAPRGTMLPVRQRAGG